MATLNPFDLLDDDAEDPSQLVAAKPLKVKKAAPVQPAKSGKLLTKPPLPSQAVREAKNAPAGGHGGGRGGGYGRGRGSGFNRNSRNIVAPANENGYGGGYRRSEEGDGARRGGLLVDTVVIAGVTVEASAMVIQVTLNVHVGTLSATVEQVTGVGHTSLQLWNHLLYIVLLPEDSYNDV